MKKIIAVVVVLLVVFGGVALYKNFEKENSTANDFEPYQATLTGMFLCLPHTNTSGPQTMECAFGIKTADGLYYALDFNAAQDEMHKLATNQQIRASGTVTPVERLSTDMWRKYPIKGIFSVAGTVEQLDSPQTAKPVTVTASIGKKVTALGVGITPLEVTQDSRCPNKVQCVWAGTVMVRTKIESGSGTSEMTLELEKSVTTEAETILLKEVQPAKFDDDIPTASYRFVIEVGKR